MLNDVLATAAEQPRHTEQINTLFSEIYNLIKPLKTAIMKTLQLTKHHKIVDLSIFCLWFYKKVVFSMSVLFVKQVKHLFILMN